MSKAGVFKTVAVLVLGAVAGWVGRGFMGGSGKAVIDVKPGIREDKETSRYNKNVLIEGNTFRMYDNGTLLNAYCVDGLTWRNNTIEQTTAYPARKEDLKRFVTNFCDNVQIDEQIR